MSAMRLMIELGGARLPSGYCGVLGFQLFPWDYFKQRDHATPVNTLFILHLQFPPLGLAQNHGNGVLSRVCSHLVTHVSNQEAGQTLISEIPLN
ncbi:hypothetical protein YC2023_053549 [Brassica napus]